MCPFLTHDVGRFCARFCWRKLGVWWQILKKKNWRSKKSFSPNKFHALHAAVKDKTMLIALENWEHMWFVSFRHMLCFCGTFLHHLAPNWRLAMASLLILSSLFGATLASQNALLSTQHKEAAEVLRSKGVVCLGCSMRNAIGKKTFGMLGIYFRFCCGNKLATGCRFSHVQSN